MTETYTVVGVWYSDEPIPVGVIKGEHDVTGGDETHFDGLWATSVDSTSADRAEAEAVAKMMDDQCPVCGARGDAPCESSNGRLRSDHASRVRR